MGLSILTIIAAPLLLWGFLAKSAFNVVQPKMTVKRGLNLPALTANFAYFALFALIFLSSF